MRRKYFDLITLDIQCVFKICFVTVCILFSRLQAQIVETKFEKLPVLCAPNCILEDSFGFIWIGTQQGLLKYDGYNYRLYDQKPFDTTSLSTNWITTLKEDKDGNLWVGTWGGGLNYFNQRTEKFVHYTGNKNQTIDISKSNISIIIVNDDESLWVGTQDQGLLHINFDSNGYADYKKYTLSGDIEYENKTWNNSILTLFKDHNGKLWIGTRTKGLQFLDPLTDEIKEFVSGPQNPYSISNNTVSSICEDASCNLWIGTGYWMTPNGKGLYKLNLKTEKIVHFEHNNIDSFSLCSNNISSLLISKDSIMWIGTIDDEVNSITLSEMLFNPEPHFTHHSGSFGIYVTSIYEDRLGNIWFSSYGGGVFKYSAHQNPFIWYRPIRENTNLQSKLDIFMIYEDRLGKIWFGFIAKGLYCYDQQTGQFTHYQEIPVYSGFVSNWITGMCEDNKGFYWFSTIASGLFRLNPTTGTYNHFLANPKNDLSLVSNNITRILSNATGDIYVLTQNSGLQLFDVDENRFYQIDIDTNSIADEEIFGFYEDNSGTLWIGTWNNGLYAVKIKDHKLINLEHFVHDPSDSNSISNNFIACIIRPQVIDTLAIWVATGNGLNRLDLTSKKFTHLYIKDGLPSNTPMNILEDNKGDIWCAFSSGMAVYNINTSQIRTFGKEDGLPFIAFNGRYQNAVKKSDGQLIFGGTGEAVGFYPEQLKNNSYIPPVYLTDFSIFQKSVELDTAIQFKKSLTLSYTQNVFSFKFAALNYTNSGKNQYAYIMEGFLDDWTYIGTQRTASFTNLDPGKYTFKIKASNNDGIWNEEGTSISIIILPPWWQTWWFRSIAIIFLVGLVYAIYRYRINRLLEMERMRVQIATDLHDDVGASLTKIAVHSEIIQSTEDRKKITTSSAKIGNMSREIITSLSDIIWSIDARNDKVGDLIDRMRDYLETVFPPGSISTDFQTQGLVFENNIDQTMRQNIYLIFKEAINNAAKHSCATKVNIHMTNGDAKFKLEICDNGKGIELNEKSSGYHGLQNMKLRAERIRGELKIENKNGTRIILTVKEL